MTDISQVIDCDAGYYCTSGSYEADPVGEAHGDECPTGSFCEVGSSQPTPCPAGQYNNETRRDTCRVCPEGFYCPINTTTPVSCPEGHYCLEGQGEAFTYRCPAGTFNNVTERYRLPHCQDCLPG